MSKVIDFLLPNSLFKFDINFLKDKCFFQFFCTFQEINKNKKNCFVFLLFNLLTFPWRNLIYIKLNLNGVENESRIDSMTALRFDVDGDASLADISFYETNCDRVRFVVQVLNATDWECSSSLCKREITEFYLMLTLIVTRFVKFLTKTL